VDTRHANAHNPTVQHHPSPITRALPAAAGGLLCLLITAGLVPIQPAQPTDQTTDQPAPAIYEPQPSPPGFEQAAQPAAATLTEAVVTLHSGRQITGFLIEESAESVVIRINDIDTTFPRARIAALRILAPVADRFRQLRDAVGDDDIRARMALVEWLRARRAYTLALAELEGILEIEPTNSDARTIRDWIKAHLELNSRSGSESPSTRRKVRVKAPPVPALTPLQINRIRIYEIDLRTPTRLTVPEETMRQLMVRSPGSFPVDVKEREKILESDPIDQLRILFELRARDLYDTVTVREDPPSMATFKARVHGAGGWLVNACASNRCHGGTDAGRLRLLNRRPNADETAYTNFYILENYRLADGTPLINHEQPARSPLLHAALTRKASLYPHPEVDAGALSQDWRHVFRSTNDRRFQETADWITSLYRPRPDYGIVYPPPPEAETPEPVTTDTGTDDPSQPQPDAASEPEQAPKPAPTGP